MALPDFTSANVKPSGIFNDVRTYISRVFPKFSSPFKPWHRKSAVKRRCSDSFWLLNTISYFTSDSLLCQHNKTFFRTYTYPHDKSNIEYVAWVTKNCQSLNIPKSHCWWLIICIWKRFTVSSFSLNIFFKNGLFELFRNSLEKLPFWLQNDISVVGYYLHIFVEQLYVTRTQRVCQNGRNMSMSIIAQFSLQFGYNDTVYPVKATKR